MSLQMTYYISEFVRLGKIAFIAFTVLALLFVIFDAFGTERPPHNRPPDNRPPDHTQQTGDVDVQQSTGDIDVRQSTSVDVGTHVSTDTSLATGDTILEAGSLEANPTVNIGGDGPLSETVVHGGDTAFDAGDSPVAIDTGGNTSKNESNFFALSTTFPNGHGCFGGAQGGGSDGASGGWLGLHWLNWACFSNYLSDSKKSVKVKSRLDCSGRKFRNAIAYDQPGKERHNYCVTFMTDEYLAQIEFEKQQVLNGIANGTIQTYAMNSEDNPDPK